MMPRRSILLMGRMRQIHLESLRRQVSIVLQDVFLFHGSVRENILFGRPEATEAEVIQAAMIANAHNFIMALSEGYDTLIGERGIKLSGGQKQRLSIARAVLKDAPILILDEATSSWIPRSSHHPKALGTDGRSPPDHCPPPSPCKRQSDRRPEENGLLNGPAR
jgi:ABC-type multidrug transport system fused ATPase/permease subunit